MSLIRRTRSIYVILSRSNHDITFLLLALAFEMILCGTIIQRIAYTEIDWEAYMQEVEGWLGGELDYRKLRGSTGPLVYPAGFLYLFALFRRWTSNGNDIRRAQHIFACLYVMNTAIVLQIYTIVARRLANKQATAASQAHAIWSWRVAMGLLCLSKRLHSIFVLRLFNEGPTMLLLYLSVLLFAKNYWKSGCFVFSLAVSIKMNVLLFAPGLLLLLLQVNEDLFDTVVHLAICGLTQVFLGAPFLFSYPESYLRKAFEFDRVFFYKWTVNWKILDEETFVSKPVSLLLLSCHVSVLAMFTFLWLQAAKKLHGRRIFLNRPLSPEYVVYTMFVSNFVGIAFARTLHYQFYCWYYQAMPFLLWYSASYPFIVRMLLVGMLEYAFNVFPATQESSAVLQVAHMLILVGLRPPTEILGQKKKQKE
jgi:alpha-1,3-mannosyltransferase